MPAAPAHPAADSSTPRWRQGTAAGAAQACLRRPAARTGHPDGPAAGSPPAPPPGPRPARSPAASHPAAPPAAPPPARSGRPGRSAHRLGRPGPQTAPPPRPWPHRPGHPGRAPPAGPAGTGPPRRPAAPPGWWPGPARHHTPPPAPRTALRRRRACARSYPAPAAAAGGPAPGPASRPRRPPAAPGPQRRRDHRRNLLWIMHRRQFDQPHPVLEPARHLPGDLPGQPGLPRTPRPGHCHQLKLPEQDRDVVHRPGSTDEARPRGREAMHATDRSDRLPHGGTITAAAAAVQPRGARQQHRAAAPHASPPPRAPCATHR